jgi:nitrite reductase/ring-hydroxylating ferredoxin subunit
MPHIECVLSEVPVDRPLRIEDGRNGIVVVRTTDGVAAYEDVCPHAQWRLSDGSIVDGVLECPGHGWEFCADSGRCVNVPAYGLKPVATIREGDRIRLLVESPRTVAHAAPESNVNDPAMV